MLRWIRAQGCVLVRILYKFVMSSHKFVRSLNEFVRIWYEFVMSLHNFVRSLNEFVRILYDFVISFQGIVISLNEILVPLLALQLERSHLLLFKL